MAEESNSFTYDAFLSFRGEDTRFNFIGHLLTKLEREGINTFFDGQNLRAGDDISPALSKAIEESKISVIVFSEKYATSTWCLNELVKIIECTKRSSNNKQLAFPIFYHVDPSDVRYQKKSYEKAMIDHENRFGKDSEKLKAWRSALSQAASKSGHFINTGFENNHIEAIVKKVKANIAPKPLNVGKDPVGLEYRIEEVRSLLDMKPNDNNVCMLGIYGLGGIGKTELAKALYNRIAHQFGDACFLANVREKSNKNGLEDPQKTLMSEMFEESKTMLGSTDRGIEAIKHKFCKRKVLLVLDDVDEKEQLESLAGGCDWFGPGSRIIITTRDKGFLIGCPVIQKIYEMTELNDQHSLELFCRNAFGKSHPETGYEDLCSRAVGYAKGLPLALKVIGSNLATRKSLKAWEHALRDYERIPRKGIQDVLKVSYDVLEPYAQTVFLDIACFFKGDKMEYVEEILHEYEAASNIEELVNKSLITVEHGHLDMHDLIQAMGREIVRQKADANPGKRSRLWSHQDVVDVLADDFGSDAIQGIMLDPPERIEVDWSGIAFKKMNYLRILIVRNTSFTSEPAHLPNYLRLLDWVEYPSKSFPPKFHPRNIIVFNLTKSQLTLEDPFKKYSCLTVMNFSHNQYITAMPDVSKVQRLRELRLDNCKNLIAVHESVGFLEHLAHLSVSRCTKLRNFLQRMSLPSLEVLDLDFCVKLEHFPEIVNNTNMSLKISMIQTAIEEIPDSIGNLTGLVSIEMQGCMKLKYLPSSLFKLPKVVALKIEGCSQLGESFRRFLHDVPSATNGRSILKTLYFGNSGLQDEDLRAILICFPKLEELIASKNNFVSLPACIKDSVHLTSLDVSDCQELQDIPECTNVRILNVHRCVRLEHISELPSTVRKVDARYCSSLSRETLDMLWCQVKKDICELEIVMPQNEIPDWYDYRGEGGNPLFWARGKFPNVAIALVFAGVNGRERPSRRLLVELHLVINGRCVPRKGYYNFRVEADHVLVCDLRLLFSEEEWRGLEAFLVHEWNLVQVSYEAPSAMALSCWGVFVYKQGTTNMGEYVQFMCPDPKCSNTANIPTIVPARDPKWDQRKMIEKLDLDNIFDGMLRETMTFEERDHFAGYADKDFAQEQHYVLMESLKKISEEARDVLEGKPLDDENSTLAWILRTIKEDGDGDKDDPTNFDHEDGNGMRLPMNVVEASSSGHQGSDPQQQEAKMEAKAVLEGKSIDDKNSTLPGLLEARNNLDDKNREPVVFYKDLALIRLKDGIKLKDSKQFVRLGFNKGTISVETQDVVQGSGPEQEKVMEEIFLEGMGVGLREAQRSFPSLDIDTTMATAIDKGNRVRWSQPVGNPVEMKIYMEGMINGLMEAKLRFPTLDIEATLKTIMSSRGGHEGPRIQIKLEEASTSGNQGSSTVQGSDPQQQERLMEIFSEGMGEGLREAQRSFPSLDIDITMATALDKCDRFRNRWPQRPEMEIYTEGIVNGLQEAKLSFPTLDVEATTNTVLSKGPYKGPNGAPPTFRLLKLDLDWTKVKVPGNEDDPLLESSVMMKQDNCESEDKSKLYYCQLMEEHKALRKKLEELENKNSCLLPSSGKNQYDELMEKLNSPQSALSISKSCHNLDGAASSSSSTEMYTDIGKEGCRGATQYEKLAAVLKGRDEELQRLHDAGIEGFQNTGDIQGLMNTIYLKGLMDGHLEARMVLLALDMDDKRTASVINENEEHVTHHEAARDEHVAAEAADNEDPDKTIGVVADIPSSTTDSEVDNPRDTSTPSASQLLEEFGHLFF